jgi:hypothetical protein
MVMEQQKGKNMSFTFAFTRPKGEIEVRYLMAEKPIRRKKKSRMSREVAPHQRLLRTKEAAQYLGMSERTLRKLAYGELKGAVVQDDDGKPWTWDKHELDKFIERHRTAAPMPAGVNGFDMRRRVA